MEYYKYYGNVITLLEKKLSNNFQMFKLFEDFDGNFTLEVATDLEVEHLKAFLATTNVEIIGTKGKKGYTVYQLRFADV